MNIEIKGILNPKHKRTLQKAAEYYSSLLMKRSVAASVFLNIVIKSKLEDDAEGYCHFVEEKDSIKTFRIEVQRDESLETMLLRLAHEVVHLKQFAAGELRFTTGCQKISTWQGRKINENKIDYWDLPWEVEAHGREQGLYARFYKKHIRR